MSRVSLLSPDDSTDRGWPAVGGVFPSIKGVFPSIVTSALMVDSGTDGWGDWCGAPLSGRTRRRRMAKFPYVAAVRRYQRCSCHTGPAVGWTATSRVRRSLRGSVEGASTSTEHAACDSRTADAYGDVLYNVAWARVWEKHEVASDTRRFPQPAADLARAHRQRCREDRGMTCYHAPLRARIAHHEEDARACRSPAERSRCGRRAT